jgi:type IV secretion system protein VirB11
MIVTGGAAPPGVYLSEALLPFLPFLERDDITDIFVNRPSELWVEHRDGEVERFPVEQLNTRRLDMFARQVAAASRQGINAENPIISATLPDGSRVQIVASPATRGDMAIAIRKHNAASVTLDAYSAVSLNHEEARAGKPMATDQAGDAVATLRRAVRAKANIVIAGGTSTGKTTFLNALLREIPLHERLILIEDAPELALVHPNAVGLVAARSALAEASVVMEDLLNAALRMRPDRIILGELRGPEAMTFLRAVNTGHPGSMTTIHADSPQGAIDQIAFLALQTGTALSRPEISDYIRSTVDLFVQLERRDGERRITAVVSGQSLSEPR